MDPRIGRAVHYIHDRFDTKILLAEVARAAGLSTQHFVYLFKRETGVTFKMYLKALRIEKSQQLMRDAYLSITEVSLVVGYQDLTAFGRDFKRLTDRTPSDYRRAIGVHSKSSAEAPSNSAEAPRPWIPEPHTLNVPAIQQGPRRQSPIRQAPEAVGRKVGP